MQLSLKLFNNNYQVLCNAFHLWGAASSPACLLPGPTAQYRFPSSVQELKKMGKYVSPYHTRYWKS